MNGYFSLVQYCPAMERREAANVGVLLIVPATGYAKARIVQDHSRLKRMFGPLAGKEAAVRLLLESIRGRVEVERETLATLEGLRQFIATRANRALLTEPRSVLVDGNPDDTLDELVQELVVTAERPRTKKSEALKQDWLNLVTKRLDTPRLAPYLRREVEVQVPRFISPLKAPLGYQNGRFHLIQPEEFGLTQEAKVEERISLRALQGEALYGHRDARLGDLQLTVVADFPADRPEVQQMATEVLAQHRVRVFSQEDLGQLEEEILKQGKLLTFD